MPINKLDEIWDRWSVWVAHQHSTRAISGLLENLSNLNRRLASSTKPEDEANRTEVKTALENAAVIASCALQITTWWMEEECLRCKEEYKEEKRRTTTDPNLRPVTGGPVVYDPKMAAAKPKLQPMYVDGLQPLVNEKGERLMPKYLPKGITKQIILAMDPKALRELIQKHGNKAVERRLRGEG